MKKEWIDMYAVMVKENKKMNHDGYPIGQGKAFFLSKRTSNEVDTKIIVSSRISSTISKDMIKLATVVSNNIIEGLTNGRR